ncbi:hypothetical protein CF327_g7379 [Tilletia walkeri]|nr:hypothetical protein CF327_g7379 [Tilletia walkeri]
MDEEDTASSAVEMVPVDFPRAAQKAEDEEEESEAKENGPTDESVLRKASDKQLYRVLLAEWRTSSELI